MTQRPGRRSRSARDPDDPERPLLTAVRRAVPAGLCLPLALASLAASSTGVGLSAAISWPLAALAVSTNLAYWRKVVVLWRSLPRRDDDEDGWRRWGAGDDPLWPADGPGGMAFDWAEFERQFWSYVRHAEREREHALVGRLLPAPAA